MALQGFDEAYYLQEKLTDLAAALPEWASKDTDFLKAVLANNGYTPEAHYLAVGYAEGNGPNAYFNAAEYIEAKVDALFETKLYMNDGEARDAFLAALDGADPYQHYLAAGAAEGLNPSNAFDESSYFADKLAALSAADALPDGVTTVDGLRTWFADNGLTALGHFIQAGKSEGLTVTPVPAAEQVSVDGPGDNPGTTYALTSGIDLLTGTDGDDVFVAGTDATNATLNAGDTLDGGSGTDTLQLFTNANMLAFNAGTSIKNIEKIIATPSATAATLDVSGNADVDEVWINEGTVGVGGATVTLTKAQKLGLSGTIAGAGIVTATVNDATAIPGDAATVQLDNASLTTGLRMDNVETLTLDTTGANSLTNLAGNSISTVNVTGDGSLTFNANNVSAGITVKTLDASENTGGVNVNLTGVSAAQNHTITGSSVDDTITNVWANQTKADVIDLGAGTNDTLLFTDAATITTAAQAAALSSVTNVEEIGTINTALTVDGTLVSQTRFSTDGAAGNFSMTNLAQGSTLEFGAGTVAAPAASNASMVLGADTLNVELNGGTANNSMAKANLTTTGTSTLNISSTGNTGIGANVAAITAADNQSIVLTGSHAVTLTTTAATGTTGFSIDASAFTASADITGTAIGDNIMGGSGSDTLRDSTGVDTYTGNAGKDSFIFGSGDIDTAAGAVTDIITDFTTGTDTLTIGFGAGAATNYVEASAAAADLATLVAAADAALAGAVKYYVGQVDSDSYLVTDNDATGYTDVIKLTGVALDGIALTDIVA